MPKRIIMLEESNKLDANTLLLLHGDSFVDTTGHHQIINNTNVSIVDGYFDKAFKFTGTPLQIPSSALFDFKAGDFTVDCWVKFNGTSYGFFRLNQSSGTYCGVGFDTDVLRRRVIISINGTSWLYNIYLPESWSANIWYHFAYVRKGAYVYVFVNGIMIYSLEIGNISLYSGTGYSVIGNGLSGLISEFRVSNVARWTSNFTPPTKPY